MLASPSTGFFRITPRTAGALGHATESPCVEPEAPDGHAGTAQKAEDAVNVVSTRAVAAVDPTTPEAGGPLNPAPSNLYNEEDVEPPAVPMLPCLLRSPQMRADRDQHINFLRSEAAFKREELAYDHLRRQSRILWDLIETKEKDRRLVLARLRKILSEGADLDELSDAGFTVAYTAASRGHADVLETLINNGADPTRESELGVTPLMIAQRRQRAACVDLLAAPSSSWQDRDLIGRSLPVVGRPATPPEAVAVPPASHELPASARVFKVTDRDAIEQLHVEATARTPLAPETPSPRRRRHRTTLITEQDMQTRLERAAALASRSEAYDQFELDYLDNRSIAGAASPQLHPKTGAAPKKATGASRLKSLTIKHATAAENSKLVHTVVAGAHALVDEQRRLQRDEDAWRVEVAAKHERTAAEEMELKALQWAEEEAAWERQQEEQAGAKKRTQEVAPAREEANENHFVVARVRAKTPEKVLDRVTQEFTHHITGVLGLWSYDPPKTPDQVKEQRREQARLAKQLEEEAKLKLEAEQERKRRRKESEAAAEAQGDDSGSRPGTRQTSGSANSMTSGFSMHSGSTLFQESGTKDRWVQDIMAAQQLQLVELAQLIDKLDADRAVVLSIGVTDTAANMLLNIRAQKGTGVAVDLGLNADNDRLAHWGERISHAEEARDDVWKPETEPRERILLVKQAASIIDELFDQVRTAIAIGQRRKSYMGPYEKLSVEEDCKRMRNQKQKQLRRKDKTRTGRLQQNALSTATGAQQETNVTLTGSVQGHPYDFPVWQDEGDSALIGDNAVGSCNGVEEGDDGEEKQLAKKEPHRSVLLARELRTPDPPPTPPPPPSPSAQLPKYRVIKSQLIRAGRDPSENSKLLGYTEEGEVVAALRTATLLTADRKIVQRVQLRLSQDSALSTGNDVGWVSIKQTKWNRMTEKDETDVLLELLPQPPSPEKTPTQQQVLKVTSVQGPAGKAIEALGVAKAGAEKGPRLSSLSGAGGSPVTAVAQQQHKEVGTKTKVPVSDVDEMHKNAKDRNWSRLNPAEAAAAKLLGWDPLTWDEGSPHPMEKLYWGEQHQGQVRALNPKEVTAALKLGFTEEIWDLAVHPDGKKPSFQLGLLLHRRTRNMRLWRFEQDALALGSGGGGV